MVPQAVNTLIITLDYYPCLCSFSVHSFFLQRFIVPKYVWKDKKNQGASFVIKFYLSLP